MSRPKIAVHTDVVIDYLIHHGKKTPILRIAMMKFFCYTTVFNAIELFSLATTEREQSAVASAMGAMKILGLNAKNSVRYGSWYAEYSSRAPLSVLMAGICMESKLPILAMNEKSFNGITGLRVIQASAIRNERTAEQILAAGVTM